MVAGLKQRNLWMMVLLLFVTLGFYYFYWLVVTKEALNKKGAKIPTAWLLIIPFVQFYFLFQFAEGFSLVLHKEGPISYFLLLVFLLPISILIMQYQVNKFIEEKKGA